MSYCIKRNCEFETKFTFSKRMIQKIFDTQRLNALKKKDMIKENKVRL